MAKYFLVEDPDPEFGCGAVIVGFIAMVLVFIGLGKLFGL